MHTLYAFETPDFRVGISGTTYGAVMEALGGDESHIGKLLACADQQSWDHSAVKTVDGLKVAQESKLLGHDGEVCGTFYKLIS